MSKGKNPISVRGGKARAAKLTAAQRKRSAQKAARARWNPSKETTRS